jgi:sulfite reductase (NADPH) hemoprotein beta-component
MSTENKLSEIEDIKVASRGLRGTLAESLTDNFTGAIRSDDTALVKFHGMYMQDDRDVRARRAEKKLDKLISFMIRLRLPGGKISAEQWLNLNDITENYGTGVIKITTRQTIQLHGLLKHELKDTIQGLFRTKLDSIDACGDVNRNVTCTSHADVSPLFKEIHAYADKISQHLLPKTNSYYEIWLDDEKVYDKIAEEDPLYQDRYLPRKFKIGIAIPPDNDVDVFINDLAMIAIIENDKLKGFNLAVGGGLSSTHGNSETYARLATLLGFLDSEEKVMKAVYEVITIQRDFGNRADRKLARMKYTIDNMGIENFIAELEKRTGFPLLPVQEFEFTNRSDKFGWVKNSEGKNFYTLFVENGVVNLIKKNF